MEKTTIKGKHQKKEQTYQSAKYTFCLQLTVFFPPFMRFFALFTLLSAFNFKQTVIRLWYYSKFQTKCEIFLYCLAVIL